MKIDFEVVYFDENEKFLIFRSNPERFYLLRVMDFEGGKRFGDTIKNKQEIKQGSCVIGEYLLTKEEFDIWDTDKSAFSALINTLSTTAPSDRILKLYYQLSPKSPAIPLQINLGEPTATENNLVEEMKQEFSRKQDDAKNILKDFLEGKKDLDLYFVCSDHLNKVFPAIDFEGKMFLTEGEKQAKVLTEATKLFGNNAYKVSSEEALALLINALKCGVSKVVFSQTNNDTSIFDIRNVIDFDDKPIYNSDVYNLLVRCIECGGISEPQVRANQMTLTSQLSHIVFQRAYLVAVNITDNEREDVVYLSSGAKALYDKENFVFYGAEDFEYTTTEQTKFGIRTLINNNDNTFAIPVFTGLEEFKTVFKDKDAVPMAVTIDEVFTMKTPECNTVIMNPIILGFLFSDEAMEQLKEMSKQPVTVFKPQVLEPKKEEPKETEISIPAVPRPASTEDILHLVANQLNRDDAVKKENIVKDSEKPNKVVEVDDDDNKIEEVEEVTDNTEEVDEKKETKQATETETPENEKAEKKGGLFSIFRKKKK